ncbi:MAG: tRNA (adenosine(37)-N6)-threonylcarbamoyltransferase complex dimerization subunit type 1 TsaB [Phycisphaerales bacterium]|nr:tRNA (adenosine(37)-N6)-threonylcarbamoyltransferase complex dimerization subunit type 1 TsaB [Phycisphaerales bacterium]
MLTLAIETSNPSSWSPGVAWHPGVCIGEVDGDTVRVLDLEPVAIDKPHTDDLLPAIDRLMGRLNIRPAQLERIAVSAGPGGFTAIRIAITVAQMIAETTGARAVAVPTALVIAARAPHNIPTPFGVALSSKGPSTHLTTFSSLPPYAARHSPSSLITAPDLPGPGLRALIADRHLPEAIRAEAARLGVALYEPIFDPIACLECSARLEEVDPARLSPIYPREPEAVTKWRALHGRAGTPRTKL